MRVAKSTIALYAILIAATVLGTIYQVPRAVLIGFALVIATVDIVLGNRRRRLGLGATEAAPRRRRLSPDAEDWVLLAISLMFCLIAAVIARQEWKGALVCFTFFGSCALVFGANIRRRRRERRVAGAAVRVVGSVDIYADGPKMRHIALGCLIVGTVIYYFGVDFPLLMRLLGAFIALVGLALIVPLALGSFARQFMRFEPAGITFGMPGNVLSRKRGYTFRVRWDNIGAVRSFDYHRNPFVGLCLRDLADVEVDPPAAIPRFLTLIKHRRSDLGFDVLLATSLFRVDRDVLADALARYVLNPDARAELAAREPNPMQIEGRG
jgi:hypothetical protein